MADELLEPLSGIGVARVGDVLLLTTADRLNEEHRARLRTDLERELPGIRVVVAEGVTGGLLCRPGVLCGDQSTDRDGQPVRCLLPLGHGGWHKDGPTTWSPDEDRLMRDREDA
jgi:hypothetical protein